MAEHPNVARIRDGYAALAKGDFAVFNDLFAGNLLWHDDQSATSLGGLAVSELRVSLPVRS